MALFHCERCRGYGELRQLLIPAGTPKGTVIEFATIDCPDCGGARTRQHRIEARRAASALIDGLMGFGEVAPLLNPDNPDA